MKDTLRVGPSFSVRIRVFATVAIVLVIAFSRFSRAAASSTSFGEPDESQTRLEPSALDPARAEEIDKIFAAYAKPGSPGCSVAVLQDGRLVFARGYGWANLEYDLPITPETVFEAGSVSKQFTAAALLLLAAEGKLGLGDEVRRHLPEVPDFGRPLTILHLLNHTSGLRDQWNLLAAAGRPTGLTVHTPEEILDLVSRQKELNFPPGEDYLYCNTGYTLAAWIVRRASGQSLADYSRARLFKPLGMDRTQWRDDFTAIVKGRATAYSVDRDGRFHQNMSFTNVYGNGGLLTTPSDLLVWAENFWTPRVLGREALDLMEVPGRLDDGTTLAYSLGLRLESYRGLREVSHGGSTAGYRAYLARYPGPHTAVALLSNFAGVNPALLARRVADVVLAGKFREEPKPLLLPLTAAELAEKAGLFINPKNEAVLKLGVKNGRLLLADGPRERELLHVGAGRFLVADGGEYRFEPGTGNEPDRWRHASAGDPPSIYRRVEPAAPSPVDLAEYAGRYWSGELEVYYTVSAEEGRLVLSHRPIPTSVLEPTDKDGFMSENGSVQVRFLRDGPGRVAGFTLSSGRVVRLRFTRVS